MIPGGFDVSFTLPIMTDGASVSVLSNFVVEGQTDDGTEVAIIRDGTSLWFGVRPCDIASNTPGAWVEQLELFGLGDEVNAVRIVAHNEFVTFYANGIWYYTFVFTGVDWGIPKQLYLSADTGITLTDVISSELFTGREAIYVEMESYGSSAIRDVIQERPVEIIPTHDGGLSFSYNAVRDVNTVPAHLIRSHNCTEKDEALAASEAVIYYTNVIALRDALFEEEDGFATRVFRLSNLDMDAELVARTLLDRYRKSQRTHRLDIRPDPRIEIGDQLDAQYQISATGSDSGVLVYGAAGPIALVVENFRFSINNGQVGMSITGRDA